MSDASTSNGVVQKAAPVKLNAKNMERLRAYSNIFDANVTMVVNRAVEEWLDTVGDVRIEALAHHDKQFAERDVPVSGESLAAQA